MSDDPIGKEDREEVLEAFAVEAFARLMRDKLRANKHKAHWSACSDSWLMSRLWDEHAELLGAIARGTDDEIISECADVANFAMMIADNAGRRK